MLHRTSTLSLRVRMARSLRSPLALAALSTSATAAPSRVFDATAAQERQRERRRKERAEPEPTLGIEGTTPYYTRQLVVVDPEASAPVSWPKKIEFSDHVVATYVKSMVAAGESPKSSPLKTIAATPFPATCGSGIIEDADAQAHTIAPKHDLLIFPDNLRVQDVDLSQVPLLVTQLLEPMPNVPNILDRLDLAFRPLERGHHILVCAHESRDERCGCNGPKLLRWLQDVGNKRKIPIHLYSSSHFGGHRYAANCIAYPSGDWFGLLNDQNDAAALVAALESKQPLRLHTHWRGRIALKKGEQIQMLRDALTTST